MTRNLLTVGLHGAGMRSEPRHVAHVAHVAPGSCITGVTGGGHVHVRCYRRGRGHQLKAGKRWQWMLRNRVGSLSRSKPSTSTTFISSP